MRTRKQLKFLINAHKFHFELRELPKQAKIGAAFACTAARHQVIMRSNKKRDILTLLVGELGQYLQKDFNMSMLFCYFSTVVVVGSDFGNSSF